MNKTKKILVLAILSLACFTAVTGILDKSIGFFGMQRLGEANDAYLQEAFDRSLSGFLILSGIKSGLAVIEGSEVGIGFNLEIGDIVQSVYDYVDIAWKTALAGGAVLFCDPVCADQKPGSVFGQVRQLFPRDAAWGMRGGI